MRYGSLFSGTGALDMGVQSVLGGTTAWHSDVEPGPSRILSHHWPDVPNIGDITTVDWSVVEPVDVITGGSPCQDVSHAGKRAGMREGTRSGLWASMCDAIETIKPSLVVWENVTGAHSAGADSNVGLCPLGMDHGSSVSLRATGRVVGDLAEIRYDAWWCTVRAADAGAPHSRARVFVFAWPAAADTHHGAEHGQRARSRPGQRGAGAAAHPGSVGRLGGPGVGRAGRDQAVGGEEVRHPRHGTGAPAAAADPDGLGPHGAGDARGRGAGPADGGVAAARLFPTPRASDGTKGGPNQRGSSGDLMLTEVREQSSGSPAGQPSVAGSGDDIQGRLRGVRNDGPTACASHRPEPGEQPAREPHRPLCVVSSTAALARGQVHPCSCRTDWGIYAAAIRRWEQVLGRAAPPPTQTGKRGGSQLSPAFSEFVMGLPEGHVTDPAIGLTRVQQLRGLGNGVVPQQAALATRLWLSAMSEQAAAA